VHENIKIYEQILKMKKQHNKFISSYGPFGERRNINRSTEQDEYSLEYEFDKIDHTETI